RACSRARSSAMCEGRMSGQLGEMRSLSNTGTPCARSMSASRSSASSESTTPLPMKQRTCSRRIPEGMSESTVLRPPMTRVCPALCPPWKRATAVARSASRSTTLPLPSSPHWVPMTMTNLPIPLPHEEQDRDADQHAAETGDAQLPISHLGEPSEGPLQPRGIEKRHDALEYEQQRERRGEI